MVNGLVILLCIFNFGTMKYQIELRSQKTDKWRQYTIHSTYIGAWFSAFRGRVWANLLLWLNDSNKRVETRIVEAKHDN